MNLSIEPCPHCGGKSRITARDIKAKQREDGKKFRKYRMRVICNKCHACGPPVTTEFTDLISWGFLRGSESPFFQYYANRAITAWNHRRQPGEGVNQ